jgi:hypothetical protein
MVFIIFTPHTHTQNTLILKPGKNRVSKLSKKKFTITVCICSPCNPIAVNLLPGVQIYITGANGLVIILLVGEH